VIDGLTDRLITDIKVGISPLGLSVDPELNKIYVANSRSDTVSVIDGSTNTVVDDIKVDNKPTTLAIDTIEEGVDSLVFVTNSDSNTVSVIYTPENRVETNLTVGNTPNFLTVNPIINRLYVINQDSNTVSMIDYFISDRGRFENTTAGSDIKVGRYPSSITLNPVTNKLFVTNSDSDTVSVIDGSTNTVVDEIKVGIYPYHVTANPDTNLIYVANYGSDTVSVIDGSTNTVVDEIKVGSFPITVSHNPVTDIVYVSNLGSNTISEIDKTSIVAGITFNISPSNSGFIECNGTKISDGNYIRYNISKNISCKANANSDSVFRSWTGDLPLNLTSVTEITFRPSKYGNVTGNFVPQLFTDEYWDELRGNVLGVMIPIMISVIGGYFVPSIARWLNSYRQRGYLRRIIITITMIRDTFYRNEDEYLKRFEETRRRIDELLTEGKISEQQYGILNDKISEYEDDIGKS
jgi:YVTN family beta-propeller protein